MMTSPLQEEEVRPGGFEVAVKMHLGSPSGSASNKSTCNTGDLGSISGLGRSPGEENGYPLQYPGLGNSMNYTGHRVSTNRKDTTQQLSLHFTNIDLIHILKYTFHWKTWQDHCVV